MSKRITLWLGTTLLVSTSLFGLFSAFATVEQGIGWGMLGFLAVNGCFGFSYCISDSPRDNDGGSSLVTGDLAD